MTVETSFLGCNEKCCPVQPPPGTCYYSDKCGSSCYAGYVSVAQSGLCEDLCCVPGASFWLDKCFVDCPAGYHSIQKGPVGSCLDLCAPVVPLAPTYPAQFPGEADGFARGVDASGQEVYRYEQNNQVYIIPSSDYYAWRSEHSFATEVALGLLLTSAAFHVTAYPHNVYYSASHPVVFHAAATPYYASSSFQHSSISHSYTVHNTVVNNHYHSSAPGASATPVAHATPHASGGYASAATTVATARPIATGLPVSHSANTPVAQGYPVATRTSYTHSSSTSARTSSLSRWSSARTATHFTSHRGLDDVLEDKE